jgi:2-amino-4-hydroxy-6-hydroxymethyldihydropteridine diphosphokinase
MYLKRELNDKLTTFTSSRFPYRNKRESSLRYELTIGIGGNIGDVKRRFEHLFMALQRDKRVSIERTSLILKNPPFGYTNQEDFFNSIMVLKTNMKAQTFLAYLLRLEKKFGRKRSFKDAPRTLDLDIIFFNNEIINTQTLTIPHHSWSKRESVVIPLASMSK